jgi:hypothetical protein
MLFFVSTAAGKVTEKSISHSFAEFPELHQLDGIVYDDNLSYDEYKIKFLLPLLEQYRERKRVAQCSIDKATKANKRNSTKAKNSPHQPFKSQSNSGDAFANNVRCKHTTMVHLAAENAAKPRTLLDSFVQASTNPESDGKYGSLTKRSSATKGKKLAKDSFNKEGLHTVHPQVFKDPNFSFFQQNENTAFFTDSEYTQDTGIINAISSNQEKKVHWLDNIPKIDFALDESKTSAKTASRRGAFGSSSSNKRNDEKQQTQRSSSSEVSRMLHKENINNKNEETHRGKLTSISTLGDHTSNTSKMSSKSVSGRSSKDRKPTSGQEPNRIRSERESSKSRSHHRAVASDQSKEDTSQSQHVSISVAGDKASMRSESEDVTAQRRSRSMEVSMRGIKEESSVKSHSRNKDISSKNRLGRISEMKGSDDLSSKKQRTSSNGDVNHLRSKDMHKSSKSRPRTSGSSKDKHSSNTSVCDKNRSKPSSLSTSVSNKSPQKRSSGQTSGIPSQERAPKIRRRKHAQSVASGTSQLEDLGDDIAFDFAN